MQRYRRNTIKLAEVLQEKAAINRNIEQLRNRRIKNALVQGRENGGGTGKAEAGVGRTHRTRIDEPMKGPNPQELLCSDRVRRHGDRLLSVPGIACGCEGGTRQLWNL